MLPFSLPDLASRIRAARVVETDRLQDGVKRQVLIARADRQGYVLPEEVLNFILVRSTRGMGDLMTVVKQLEKAMLQEKKRLSVPFVKQALKL